MKQIRVRLHNYDHIVLSISGGKDSSCMLHQIVQRADHESIPRQRLVAVFADLGRMEWPGTRELAEQHARQYGVRFEVVTRKQGDLLDQVLARRKSLDAKGHYDKPAWPSSTARYCTSDNKRGPIRTLFTRLAAETRATKGRSYRVRILNCMGMRAAESPARSKLVPFRLNDANGVRVIHDYLPIFELSEKEVWHVIGANKISYHYAYTLGMPRLSCAFCILASRDALLLAGHHNPSLLRDYVAVERAVRSTFKKNLALADVLADVEAGKTPGPIRSWEA